MDEFVNVVILAVIQGIAEFLPISSSGHLAIMEKILKTEDPVSLAVILHAGTLLAIMAVYFREVKNLLSSSGRKLIPKLIVATFPVAILGMTLHIFNIPDLLFKNMFIPAAGFLVTGFILMYGMKNQAQKKSLENMNYKDSLIIGLLQAIAVLPGVSRSGTTISGALKLKYKRGDSTTFSFLLAIFAIGGATAVKLYSWLSAGDLSTGGTAPWILVVGFFVSAFIGFAALNTIIESVRKGNLKGYAYYCFILGAGVIIWQIWEYVKEGLG
jgi:undecaprenyl-diphosphatase